MDSVYGEKKHVVVLEPLLEALAAADSATELRRKIEDLFHFLDSEESGYVNFYALLFGLLSMT
jgi:Ca2+-binding EF-hand superfamily protein